MDDSCISEKEDRFVELLEGLSEKTTRSELEYISLISLSSGDYFVNNLLVITFKNKNYSQDITKIR